MSPTLKLDHDELRGMSVSYARACEPFAAMSALVYSPSKPGEQATEKAKQHFEEESAIRRRLTERLTRDGWKEDSDFRPTDAARKAGLSYQVWMNETYARKLVVIAFRGTEPTDKGDWESNAYWLTHYFEKDTQYAFVRDQESGHEIEQIFAKYRDGVKRGSTAVITTGHSLGGGLAQAVRYHHMQEVTQCYAFNSSPVTTYYQETDHRVFKMLPPVEGFPSQLTLRVYERGEVLAYVRAPLRWFHHVPDQIRDVRFNFIHGKNLVSQHSMHAFADNLAAESATRASETVQRIPNPWWMLPKENAWVAAGAQ